MHLNSLVFFYLQNDQKKVGFTASKKIGNAVKRNFAKRRLRALFIKKIDFLKSGTYVFVAKKEIVGLPFSDIENEFCMALKKMGLYAC